MPTKKTKEREDRNWYKILINVHLCIGLGLSIPFIMLGITGSILVFEHELEEIYVKKPVYELAQGEEHRVEEIIAVAGTSISDELLPTMYRPAGEGEPALVRFSNPSKQQQGSGGNKQILIDPVSLTVFGEENNTTGVLRTIKQLHANLLTKDRSGRAVIGWFGIAMLLLGISGLIMWWPRNGKWKAAFTVKKNARGFRLHRDLHGAVGIWGWLVFLVVTFSGIYLAFPQQTGAVITTIFPGRDLRASANAIKVIPEEGSEISSVDSAIELAKTAVPNGKLLSVMIPSKPEQPYRVNIARLDYQDGAPSITAFIDPWKNEIIELRDPRNYTIGETITAWQHAIHGGHGTPMLWKLLVFFTGFMPPLFVVTGFYMWFLKRRKRS